MHYKLMDELAIENTTKIVYLIIDGVGGLQMRQSQGTELQNALKPNLDRLARESICGLLDPIYPGITPGSGPAHFALFGYDPIECNIGRGVLEAAGIGFDFTDRDVAVRINFATADKNGNVIDRRAGRLDTEINKGICQKLQKAIDLGSGIEVFVRPVKEHRAVLVLRGEGLSGEIEDTDPQRTGVPPLEPAAIKPEAEKTVSLVKEFLHQARETLAHEDRANMILLRGFAKFKPYPSLKERFKLKALAIADYPMYRGVARLIGMDICPESADFKAALGALAHNYDKYDFFYLHVKATDSRGEDGNFHAKVNVIEKVDSLLPPLTKLNPDVLVVTADHSTPAKLASHSWHPVPVLIHSQYARVDEVEKFDEINCSRGGLGRQPAVNLMGLALAHALRLKKYGA